MKTLVWYQTCLSNGFFFSSTCAARYDSDANDKNPLLESEQRAQVSNGQRGDVTLLPTVVINERQYRGKLERSAVLATLCAGQGCPRLLHPIDTFTQKPQLRPAALTLVLFFLSLF